MPVRSYAGAAKRTSLAGDITATSTNIVVADATGYPTGVDGPFAIAVDVGVAAEEKILVASRSGNTLTVATGGRGYDGTTAAAHLTGSNVDHVLTAVDVREANAHVNDTTGDPHPQYIGNTGGDTITASAATVIPLVVKGAASQTANLAEFQNSAGTVLAAVNNVGTIYNESTLIYGKQADTDGNRAHVLVIGTNAGNKGLIVRGAASQTANLAEFQDSSGTVLLSVTADGNLHSGGTFSSARDVAVKARAAANTVLTVQGAASQTGNLAEFLNSAGTVLAGFNASGQMIHNLGTRTSALAGGASALPGAPAGYMDISINGVNRTIPFWAT